MFGKEQSTTMAMCSAAVLVLAATAVASEPLAMREPNGRVACLVEAGSTNQAVTVWIRVPATPAGDLVSRLPADRRDFAALPVIVRVVPSAGATEGPAAIEHPDPVTQASTFEHPVIDGRRSDAPFVKVTYRRAALTAGRDLVAQRTARAAEDQQVVSETRCRLTPDIVRRWQ